MNQPQPHFLLRWATRPIRAMSIILAFMLIGSTALQSLDSQSNAELRLQLSNPRSFRIDLLPPGALLRIDLELRNQSVQLLHNAIVVLPYRREQLTYLESSGKAASNALFFTISDLAPTQSWHGHALFHLDHHLAAGIQVTLQAAVAQAGRPTTLSESFTVTIEEANTHSLVSHA